MKQYCPKCKEILDIVDEDAYDWDDDFLIERVVGECPTCGKQYWWHEHYVLKEVSEFEEIEKDDQRIEVSCMRQ